MEGVSASVSSIFWLKQSFLILVATCLLVQPILGTVVKYCDKKGDYGVEVQGVEIFPNPVVSGKPATFNISGSTGQAISGGKVVIDVSYFSIHVHTEIHDLCEEISCPIAVGSFVLSHTQTLPAFTPPGSYTLKMTMRDDKDEILTCVASISRLASETRSLKIEPLPNLKKHLLILHFLLKKLFHLHAFALGLHVIKIESQF